ncbi:alpha/beta hydrolase [Maribacter sp. 2210JD10-5]|uniref:alpha/beta hydrolase n=1 Tax=Maribacter sp. 2210JD10-5 TaxID=3386272 RepID=UPI0039BD7626
MRLINIVKICLVFTSLGFMGCAPRTLIISLWPEGQVPNQIGTHTKEYRERTDILRIKNVQEPTIEVFLPEKSIATGKAVLIFPGGGYGILAYDWEGTDIANFLKTHGIAGIVVKYRLPSDESHIEKYNVPLIDAQRAMRLVRSNADGWNIDSDQIGIIGFSAGGHLASTLGTKYNVKVYDSIDVIDNLSARPDFMALIYPVITMGEKTHQGSKENLLGKNAPTTLVHKFSSQLHVMDDTPSAFIVHAMDDEVVPVANSEFFHGILSTQRGGSKSSLLLYEKGGHGFSLAKGTPYLEEWPQKFITWMSNLEKD